MIFSYAFRNLKDKKVNYEVDTYNWLSYEDYYELLKDLPENKIKKEGYDNLHLLIVNYNNIDKLLDEKVVKDYLYDTVRGYFEGQEAKRESIH